MLQDGLTLTDASIAYNFQIQNGATLPVTGNNLGELFYLTSGTPGLYIYNGSSWVASTVGEVSFDSLNVKGACRAATTASITLAGTQTIDGVALVAGDRILVKNQATGSQNGIYVVAAGTWARASDFDGSPSNEVKAGDFTFISEGTVNGDTGWMLTTNGTIVIGSTSLTFAQFTASTAAAVGGSEGSVQYNSGGLFAGSGDLTFSGQTLSVGATTNSGTRLNVFSGIISSGIDNGVGGPLTIRPSAKNGNNGNALTLQGGAAAGQAGGYIYVTGGTEGSVGYGGGYTELNGGAGSAGGLGGRITLEGAFGTGSTYGTGYGTGGGIVLSTTSSGTQVERFRIYNNGAWSVGSNGTSTGTAGQVLTSTGSATPPTWQDAAGGTAAAGTLTGTTLAANVVSSSLTSVGTLSSLTVSGTTTLGGTTNYVGPATGGVTLQTQNNDSIGAGALTIQVGTNNGSTPGLLSILGGQAGATSGTGGSIKIQGGAGVGGGSPTGGSVEINGGIAGGTGGAIVFKTAPAATLTERFRILNNGAWSVGSVGNNTGTSGQVLTSTGSGSAPTWQSPAAAVIGADTQVAFNNAGTMAGDVGFTWNNSSRTLTIGSNSTAPLGGTLRSPNAGTVTHSALTIKAGNSTSNSIAGGALTLSAGDAASGGGPMGSVTISGGAPGAEGSQGGNITLAASNSGSGAGSRQPGDVIITAGNATGSAEGGLITFTAGTSATGTAGYMTFTTGGTERMRIDGAGNTGFGNVTPNAGSRVTIRSGNNNTGFGSNGDLYILSNNQTVATQYGWNQLNSSGDYYIGRNGSARIVVAGAAVTTSGVVFASSFDGSLGANGTPGDIITRRSSSAGALYFGDSSGSYLYGISNTLNVGTAFASFSAADNSCSSGTPAGRWTVVYAVTGSINTSDFNAKTEIADLSVAEKNVATAIKGLIKKFKFKDAVALKGSANARIHVGVIAQDVEQAFIAEGLDPRRYGVFCEDTWYELPGQPVEPMDRPVVTAETPGAVAVTRLGVRYDELLAFVISAL